jgi:hypothetical protein
MVLACIVGSSISLVAAMAHALLDKWQARPHALKEWACSTINTGDGL